MIIWLASYPRSGNTLLRTVINMTLGRTALPDRSEWPRLVELFEAEKSRSGSVGTAGHPQAETGVQWPTESWDSFYPKAIRSPEIQLVKTHEAPIDGQPAIYVVRNGRKATYSYYEFNRAKLPELGKTLLDLIVGNDFYGDWSSHFAAWMHKPNGRRLLLRYEDLVNADAEMVARLASFVGHTGPVTPWVNPFSKLQKADPNFYREGRIDWEPPEAWTDECEMMFRLLHGPRMAELGYEERPLPFATPASGWSTETVETLARVREQRDQFQAAAANAAKGVEKLKIQRKHLRTRTQRLRKLLRTLKRERLVRWMRWLGKRMHRRRSTAPAA